jgi:hypothetical protein
MVRNSRKCARARTQARIYAHIRARTISAEVTRVGPCTNNTKRDAATLGRKCRSQHDTNRPHWSRSTLATTPSRIPRSLPKQKPTTNRGWMGKLRTSKQTPGGAKGTQALTWPDASSRPSCIWGRADWTQYKQRATRANKSGRDTNARGASTCCVRHERTRPRATRAQKTARA